MTRDEIIRMAQEAGLSWTPPRAGQYDGGRICSDVIGFQRFAALVKAAVREKIIAEMTDAANEACQRAMEFEREECAKVCDGKVDAEYATGKVDHNEMGWTQACAITIRARGQL